MRRYRDEPRRYPLRRSRIPCRGSRTPCPRSTMAGADFADTFGSVIDTRGKLGDTLATAWRYRTHRSPPGLRGSAMACCASAIPSGTSAIPHVSLAAGGLQVSDTLQRLGDHVRKRGDTRRRAAAARMEAANRAMSPELATRSRISLGSNPGYRCSNHVSKVSAGLNKTRSGTSSVLRHKANTTDSLKRSCVRATRVRMSRPPRWLPPECPGSRRRMPDGRFHHFED